MCVCVFAGALLGVVLQSALPLQGQALHMAINLGRTRLLLFENAGSSIPFPVLLVLVFWLTIIFASFGLFAPRNATVVAAFLVTALPVSGAIFLYPGSRSVVRRHPSGVQRPVARGADPSWWTLRANGSNPPTAADFPTDTDGPPSDPFRSFARNSAPANPLNCGKMVRSAKPSNFEQRAGVWRNCNGKICSGYFTSARLFFGVRYARSDVCSGQ